MTDAALFAGGRVFTGRRYVEALLVEEGRVLAAGPEDEVRRRAATGTDRVDLRGGLVVPGLADAHVHVGDLAQARNLFDAGPVRSLPDLRERLRRWARDHAVPAVVGQGLEVGSLTEHRWPTVAELDAIAPDQPLILFQVSGHAAVTNTVALEQAYGSSPPPARHGVPSGVVVEADLEPLRQIVDRAFPVTPSSIRATLLELAGLGLTTVGTMSTSREELSVLDELDRSGHLPIGVRAYPPLRSVSQGPVPHDLGGPRRFVVAGVKGFLDGAFGPRTASLTEPYADEPATAGIDRGGDPLLPPALEAAARAGLSVALHAIGDRAVARAASLLSGVRAGDRPLRIEHASLTPPPVLGLLPRTHVHLVVQPGFLLTDTWLRERLGAARARWAYAFRTLRDLAVPLAGSSDAPYGPADPWLGMRAAVRRQDELGRSANPWPGEALTEPEALALYTEGAHRALGDAAGGGLEPDAPADLVVLSVHRLGQALERGGSAVRETWVAGQPVVRAGPT